MRLVSRLREKEWSAEVGTALNRAAQLDWVAGLAARSFLGKRVVPRTGQWRAALATQLNFTSTRRIRQLRYLASLEISIYRTYLCEAVGFDDIVTGRPSRQHCRSQEHDWHLAHAAKLG
jgi:hypothetical protein